MEIKGQRYRVDREIGKGAFGVVFLAHDNRLQRNVALKVMAIPEGLSSDDVNHLIERFYREARAAASLSHPNIVIIHDISKTKDRHFISMEFLQGRPLSDLTEGPIKVGRALTLFDQMLDGLEYAHDKGVIHRDIKPDNIFVMPGDKVKLVDFGLARVQTTSTLTKTGTVMGSPGYIAPEMIEGKRADNRTDIFSAGVVLYEMLTGERPFGPKTSFESYANIIYRILSKDPQAPSLVNPEVPGELDALVVRCLAKNPDDRFQTVSELRAAVAAIADTLPAEEAGKEKRREKKQEKEAKRQQMEAMTTDMSGPAAAIPAEPAEPYTRIEDGAQQDVEEIDLFGPEEKKGRVSRKALAIAIGACLALAAVAVVLILVFAGGGGSARCPNLINLDKSDALKAIKDAGLKVGKETEAFSYDIWKGKVARQFPVSGTEVQKGSSVEIVVSIGQDVAAVPDVVNKHKAEAIAAITSYGFKVKTKVAFSDTVPLDIVMEARPAPGTVKPRGDTVLIVVSKGPFPKGSAPPPRRSGPSPPPG